MYIDVYKRFIEFWSPVESNSSSSGLDARLAVRRAVKRGSILDRFLHRHRHCSVDHVAVLHDAGPERRTA